MLQRKVTICNKLGLHARAAAKLVQLAGRFEADVRLVRDGREANAKSIMGVMMLSAGRGSEIELVGDGNDEQAAIEAVEQLIANRFGEDE
ncbi:MAG: HPr family phosphocarrier protein [Gammaproteobacteria bacterium]